ncbi:PREDICTED: cyclic GMP-AMP synthase [Condylura cristata]|uniref:cyclic GMP-AMP synthase n=1 Tax=Condylura cristata TaxID=143302 RepID=UPI0003344BAB|nr:PREDICTED: cyclic GMP-AMP synthase [Condylura cristata]
MDPRRGKVDQAASKSSKARAAARKTYGLGATDSQAKPPESPATPGASGLDAPTCDPTGESESLPKKGAQHPHTGRRVSARGAGAKKAPLRFQDPQSPGAPGTVFRAQTCDPTRESGSQRKKGAQASENGRRVSARDTGAKRASLCSQDVQCPGAPRAVEIDGPAVSAEGLEPAGVGEPALPAGSSRSRGSARSSVREPRSPPGPTRVPTIDPQISAPALGGREAAVGSWKLRSVLEKLKLNRQEISAAAVVVNRVVDHLLQRMQSHESEFKGVERLSTGSYYEHVKISAPNEFDVMFTLKMPRIQLEEYCDSGTHYLVKLKRNPKGNPLSGFLENEVLSASKMLSKFRAIIKEEIKNIRDTNITVERKKRGSPAVTLLIRNPEEISLDIILALESRSSWPACTQQGLPIKNWLGTKVRQNLRQQPFYLVPKHAKEENGFQEDTWRLSFSNIEKVILNNHGHSKTCCESKGMECCRKKCLKLMKCLLEQLKSKFENRKELDKFCSYHVKTAFFDLCTQCPQDEQWHSRDLELCFDRCVAYFLECLKEGQLQHYFIPRVNLFSQEQINKISKDFLLKQIEYERNNGFPIFDEF